MSMLSTADVAAALRVSRSSVVRLARSGELTPAERAPGLRGAMLFDPEDVAAYVASRDTASV